jgi:predicted MPP superfamily phosphohydrolase
MLFTFYVISLCAYLSISAYLFVRGWQALPKYTILRIFYSIIFCFFTSSLLIGFYFKNWFSFAVVNFFKAVEGFWVVFLLFFLFSAVLADFVRLLHHFFHIFPEWIIKNWQAIKQSYFYLILIILTIITLIGFSKFAHPQITDLNIILNKDTYKKQDILIVAISDIHIGNIIGKKRLARWIKVINQQQPDLILITGDLFDQNFDTSRTEKISKELAKLKAHYGIYAILGNHEYYTNTEKAIECMRRAGIVLLRDQSVIIDSQLVIIGRDDATNIQRKYLSTLLSGVDTTLPIVVLDHQPSNLEIPVYYKIDLQLSGHLHNGQLFPYNLFLKKNWPVIYGLVKNEHTHIYITSGLGASLVPIRMGTKPEIVRIKLTTLSKN